MLQRRHWYSCSRRRLPLRRRNQAEISVAQQYGVSFLPLMVMERDKLVEKHAKAAGLGDIKVNWVSVAGPSVMNDGVISGAIQFIAVGAPSLITLWDKTKGNVAGQGHVGDDHVPALPHRAQPGREVDQGLHREGQDRGAVGQGLDPGDHAADGGGEALRRRQLRQVRPAHRRRCRIPTRCLRS